jgi:hypothetical protein
MKILTEEECVPLRAQHERVCEKKDYDGSPFYSAGARADSTTVVQLLDTVSALRTALEAHGITITCENCPQADRCDYAFDGYNTNGDCLAEK